MNIWCSDDLVHVGTGALTWRIDSFTQLADGSTLAHLESIARADVHTTVLINRLREAS